MTVVSNFWASLVLCTAAINGAAFSKDTYADFVTSLSATEWELEDLGVCSDASNHIWGASLGADGKPVIMFTAGIHAGFEWQGSYVLRQFMSFLASPPPTHAETVRQLLLAHQFYAIPCVNPYGWINTLRGNANAVDLNRNYAPGWSTYDDVEIESYGLTKGASALSEAESVIVAGKIAVLDPIGFIDVHYGGSASGLSLLSSFGQNDAFWVDRLAFLGTWVGAPTPRIFPANTLGPWPLAASQARSNLSPNGYYPVTTIMEMVDEDLATASRRGLNFLFQASLAIAIYQAQGWYETTFFQPGPTGIDTNIISGVFADNNYGAGHTMSCGLNGGRSHRPLYKCDLSDIPPTATIRKATLKLYCYTEIGLGLRTMGVHRALTEWFEGVKDALPPDAGESGSTWNYRNVNGSVPWGAAGGLADTDYAAVPVATAAVGAAPCWTEWDVTADVAAFVAGGAVNYGWWVIDPSESEGYRKSFASSDYSIDWTTGPRLDVEWEVASEQTALDAIAALATKLDTVKAKTDTIGALTIIVSSPVAASGTITLYAGDDYDAAHGRSIDFTVAVADAPDLVGATVKLKAKQATWTATGCTSDGTDWTIVFEPDAADTAALTWTQQSYEVEATLADSDVVTLATGTLIVVKDITVV